MYNSMNFSSLINNDNNPLILRFKFPKYASHFKRLDFSQKVMKGTIIHWVKE